MSGNKKHVVSILLVAILLMPTIIKLEHHPHDHVSNHEEDNKSTTYITEKCIICDFQFSTFNIKEYVPISSSLNYAELVSTGYVISNYLNNTRYSFLLRAPPVLQLA